MDWQMAEGAEDSQGLVPKGRQKLAQHVSAGNLISFMIQSRRDDRPMSHSYIFCLVHLVFATSERRATIRAEIEEPLNDYLGGIAAKSGMPALAVGGTADHVHLLLSLPRTLAIGKAVQLLKANSSKWVHDTYPKGMHFSWQEGHAAFSIGVSQQPVTIRYIQRQHEHHKRMSFEEELKKFLAVHEIDPISARQ
jgi:putative transposase